jgi:hypothetical protein
MQEQNVTYLYRLGVLGSTVNNVDELLAFELAQADGLHMLRTLASGSTSVTTHKAASRPSPIPLAVRRASPTIPPERLQISMLRRQLAPSLFDIRARDICLLRAGL